MKIYYPAGDRTPDLLNQRQTCYLLSQRDEQVKNVVIKILNIVRTRKVHVSCDVIALSRIHAAERVGNLLCGCLSQCCQLSGFSAKFDGFCCAIAKKISI